MQSDLPPADEIVIESAKLRSRCAPIFEESRRLRMHGQEIRAVLAALREQAKQMRKFFVRAKG